MKLDYLFSYGAVSRQPARILEPLSWVGHIPFAFWLVEKCRPRTIVELGTHTGNSYFALCQAVEANGLDATCCAVDTWQGDCQAGYYGEDVYLSVSRYNQSHYSGFSRLFRMTFDEALKHFQDGSIDCLHIDGLHSYEAVRHDFESWLPKMSGRGVVLFHDNAVREEGFGVWRLWQEVSPLYPHIEFDHSFGLGGLFVGKEQPAAVLELLEGWGRPDGKRLVQDFFARLGHLVESEWRNDNHGFLLAERERLLTQRDAELAECIRAIQSMNDTLSWRLTAPLRWIGRKVLARK